MRINLQGMHFVDGPVSEMLSWTLLSGSKDEILSSWMNVKLDRFLTICDSIYQVYKLSKSTSFLYILHDIFQRNA